MADDRERSEPASSEGDVSAVEMNSLPEDPEMVVSPPIISGSSQETQL